jgi:hypothetical protein
MYLLAQHGSQTRYDIDKYNISPNPRVCLIILPKWECVIDVIHKLETPHANTCSKTFLDSIFRSII